MAVPCGLNRPAEKMGRDLTVGTALDQGNARVNLRLEAPSKGVHDSIDNRAQPLQRVQAVETLGQRLRSRGPRVMLDSNINNSAAAPIAGKTQNPCIMSSRSS